MMTATGEHGWQGEEGEFAFGDLTLASGQVIPRARARWKTYGTLSERKDNVVIYPTSYSARHTDQEWLIGRDGILDPTRWFIVTVNAFGNGLSSSPSNTPGYPALVTNGDNVRAQWRVVHEVFGVEEVACVYGWSMGGQQAYHWAATFPERVKRIVVLCGTARTSVHNRVFLAGMTSILESAQEYVGGGRFRSQPVKALRAFARNYAAWALSQDFYRAQLHVSAMGAPDLEGFLQSHWEARYLSKDAADLYAQLKTWEANDISDDARYGGNLSAALAAIKAHVLLMPGETDLYFRTADSEAEARQLPRVVLRPIPSIWGHRAGSPSQSPEDFAFVRDVVRAFLGDRRPSRPHPPAGAS